VSTPDRKAYVQAVLALYRRLPGTNTRPRPADRRLAAELHRRGIPLEIVEIALRLAALRRTARPPDATPLPPVRSLHYFLPVIDELPKGAPPHGYLEYLRHLLPDRRPDAPANTPHQRSPRHTPQLRLPVGDRRENDVS